MHHSIVGEPRLLLFFTAL